MLTTSTDSTEQVPLSLAIMDRQQLTRDCLARLLSQTLGLAVVGSCDTVAALERIVAQRRPNVALVALHCEQNLETAIGALVARLEHTRLVLLAERSSPDLERRCNLAGAAGCISKEHSLQSLELMLRRIGAGQTACAGHDRAQLLAGQPMPAVVNFGQGTNLRPGESFEPASLKKLTRRETDVLLHIAQGYTVKQCAEALGISPSTADNHKSRMMRKLNVHKTVDLVRLAMRSGLSPGALAPTTGGHAANSNNAANSNSARSRPNIIAPIIGGPINGPQMPAS